MEGILRWAGQEEPGRSLLLAEVLLQLEEGQAHIDVAVGLADAHENAGNPEDAREALEIPDGTAASALICVFVVSPSGKKARASCSESSTPST